LSRGKEGGGEGGKRGREERGGEYEAGVRGGQARGSRGQGRAGPRESRDIGGG
jgi:hypothetical protein